MAFFQNAIQHRSRKLFQGVIVATLFRFRSKCQRKPPIIFAPPFRRQFLPVILGDLRWGFVFVRSGVFKQFTLELAPCLVRFVALSSWLVLDRVDTLRSVAPLEAEGSSVREAIVVKATLRSPPILSHSKFPTIGLTLTKSKFHRRCFSFTIRLNSSRCSLLSWSWSIGPNRFLQRERLIPRLYLCLGIAKTGPATLATLITNGKTLSLGERRCLLFENSSDRYATNKNVERTTSAWLVVKKFLNGNGIGFHVCSIRASHWLIPNRSADVA